MIPQRLLLGPFNISSSFKTHLRVVADAPLTEVPVVSLNF